MVSVLDLLGKSNTVFGKTKRDKNTGMKKGRSAFAYSFDSFKSVYIYNSTWKSRVGLSILGCELCTSKIVSE